MIRHEKISLFSARVLSCGVIKSPTSAHHYSLLDPLLSPLYLPQNMTTLAVYLRRVYRAMPTTPFLNASVLVSELSTVCCNRVTTSHSKRRVRSPQQHTSRILLGSLFSHNPNAQSLFVHPNPRIRAFIIYPQPVSMAFLLTAALLFEFGTSTTLHPACIRSHCVPLRLCCLCVLRWSANIVAHCAPSSRVQKDISVNCYRLVSQ